MVDIRKGEIIRNGKLYKRFGGKWYAFLKIHKLKKDALKTQKKYKKRGMLCRISKESYYTHGGNLGVLIKKTRYKIFVKEK